MNGWVFFYMVHRATDKRKPLRSHRRDSIQGTDYIANYIFLNLKVSRPKIQNLKWWIGRYIIPLTFGNFLIS